MFTVAKTNEEVKGPLDGILNSELTAGQRTEVEELVTRIVNLFPSVKLAAFVGRSDQPFTFHFLLLIDDKEPLAMDDIAAQLEEACKGLSAIAVIAEKVTDVRLKCEKANDFYTEVLMDKTIFYSARDFVFHVKPDIPLSGRKAELKRDWQNMKQQTETLAQAADVHFNDGHIGLALISLKQAVKNAIKSVIKVLLDYEPETKDIARLIRMTLLVTSEIKDNWLLQDWQGPRLFDLLMKADSNNMDTEELEKQKLTVEGIIAKVRRLMILATQLCEQEVYEF